AAAAGGGAVSRAVETVLCPEAAVAAAPYAAQLALPDRAQVGRPLSLEWKITNQGVVLDTLSLRAGAGSGTSPTAAGGGGQGGGGFLWGGPRQMEFQVAPGETYSLGLTLVPLAAGHQELPYFEVTSQWLGGAPVLKGG
ncbi:unnamed protein product, partial [Heterosigma akashiwo]